MGRAAILAAFLVLAGCATIFSGTSETIAIMTEPVGAKCVLSRENQTIAVVEPTPGTATVQKDKHDILVSCDKQGYQTGTANLHSGVEGGTFGNLILVGGLVGLGIDGATGADNHYPETAAITMLPAANGASTASNGLQTGQSANESAPQRQGGPIVMVDCRWKDGRTESLVEQDCVEKGGTVGGARLRPTSELN